MLVAAVSNVVNLICDYLVGNRCWLRGCKGCKVSILTLSYRKGLGGRVCMWEISSFFHILITIIFLYIRIYIDIRCIYINNISTNVSAITNLHIH